ncbi:hypothetical protein J2W56_005982 [Nocardia kruczakiae]|uniref:Resolvase/invertase-type recombinase catalytic domain-containing protein n=1 Tax=Nocardia kruczakiae TaxID=261477 RepID=A0ABU1XNS8_9NOCA|nr:recombinase family protein [Nocardia kruczakiae]MDR7172221.1 hypothetical protein [Nocardia kruczakiae]
MPIVPARAVIYLRVSLDQSGEGLAVERQREDCEQIAAARGWTVIETYTDNSISAFDKVKNRPAYDRMVDDYRAGRFNALITWDLDRLTRQPRQLEDWIDAAESQGLRLVTANGEADLQTDGGRMYARIKAAVARAEMNARAPGKAVRSSNAPRRAARPAASGPPDTHSMANSFPTRPMPSRLSTEPSPMGRPSRQSPRRCQALNQLYALSAIETGFKTFRHSRADTRPYVRFLYEGGGTKPTGHWVVLS